MLYLRKVILLASIIVLCRLTYISWKVLTQGDRQQIIIPHLKCESLSVDETSNNNPKSTYYRGSIIYDALNR
ncbi:hypothetical protein Fokcrypt_00173 [Candidatus Fokinia cryptica]|uniref:Uncharacterized protein n=1 Tax=Candidatus Fokinia crypta TaxID=1920990 RepID=A0ABZ0URN0_9RICK|nr:hypothetical protein Fokcrypt_00173 [Candidatus Fokinia cryptica]